MNKSPLYKGSLTTIILQLLFNEGAMYGYEVTQKVKDLTNGQLDIKEGALYPLLHKLEAEGHLTVFAKKVDNRIRKYYRLTECGTKESKTKIQELQEYLEMMNKLINLSPT